MKKMIAIRSVMKKLERRLLCLPGGLLRPQMKGLVGSENAPKIEVMV